MWTLDYYLKFPKTVSVEDRQRAARAVEARLGVLGMTQLELAEAAGVDAKTVNGVIRRGVWPYARTRARIEAALGWPPGEMARIAAEDDAAPRRATPEGLLAAIYDELPPERAARVAALVEAELSGRPAPAPTGRR